MTKNIFTIYHCHATQESPSCNPFTLSTLATAIDKAFGNGFTKLLEATNKFKLITSDEIDTFLKGDNKSLENYRHGIDAVDTVIRTHSDVQKAMHRDELGDIDFLWGDNPGTPEKNYHDGGGLLHILLARQAEGMTEQQAKEFTVKIVEAIAFGTFEPNTLKSERSRAIIEHNGIKVVLAKKYGALKQNWVVTGYKVSSDVTGKGSGLPRSTQPLPMPSRQGLGAELKNNIPPSADISNIKFSKSSQTDAPDIRYSKDGRILAFVIDGNTYLVADKISSPVVNDDPP